MRQHNRSDIGSRGGLGAPPRLYIIKNKLNYVNLSKLSGKLVFFTGKLTFLTGKLTFFTGKLPFLDFRYKNNTLALLIKQKKKIFFFFFFVTHISKLTIFNRNNFVSISFFLVSKI